MLTAGLYAVGAGVVPPARPGPADGRLPPVRTGLRSHPGGARGVRVWPGQHGRTGDPAGCCAPARGRVAMGRPAPFWGWVCSNPSCSSSCRSSFWSVRQWRALASFLGISALTGLLTLAVFGVDVVRSWLAALASDSYAHEVQVEQAWKMQSVSALLASVLRWEGIAYVVLLGGVAAACLYLRRSTPDLPGLGRRHRAHDRDVAARRAVRRCRADARRSLGVLDTRHAPTAVAGSPLRRRCSGPRRCGTPRAGGLPWVGDVVDAPWAAVPLAWFLVRSACDAAVGSVTQEAGSQGLAKG